MAGFFSGLAKSNPFTAGIETDYEFNMEQSKRAILDSQYEAGLRRQQADRLTGMQVASYGASGVEVSGSALGQIRQDQVDAEVEAMNIVFGGKMKSAQMKYQAKMAKNQAYLSIVKEAGLAYATGGGSLGFSGARSIFSSSGSGAAASAPKFSGNSKMLGSGEMVA